MKGGPRVLVSGFNAFAAVTNNPSAMITRALRGQFNTAVLPVEYDRGLRKLTQAFQRANPDVYIGFGIARNSSSIRIEMIARNRANTTLPDVAGKLPAGKLLDPDGPDAYPTLLPTLDIMQTLDRNDIPWTSSNDAGDYLCNAAFYHAVRTAFAADKPVAAGFIHVPPVGVNGFTEQKLVDAAKIIIGACKAA